MLAITVFIAWNELTFFDDSGEIHTLRFDSGGLILLTLVKVAASLLCVKWGLDALKTFSPIVREVERE